MNELDPLAAVTADDPYPYYARLVANRPFHYDESCRMFVAASAEAVETVLSSAAMRVRPPSEQVPRPILDTPLGNIFQRQVRMTDGPSQVDLKRAVRTTLDPIDRSQLAATSERCAKLLARDVSLDDPADLSPYMFGLPALVIAATLGFAPYEASQAIGWTKLLVRSLASGSVDEVARGNKVVHALTSALHAIGEVPSASGSLFEDFRAVGRRYGIDDTVIVANAIGFLSQSYDATAGLIGSVLVRLAAAPSGLRAAAVDNDDLLDGIVAETAHYDAPIQNTRRFAVGDVNVMGARLREGDVVLVLLAAANRDPRVNPDPDRFVSTRGERRTYTFGIGAHTCPGAKIATMIARAGVAQLLRSGLDFEALHVAGYHPSVNARIPHIVTA